MKPATRWFDDSFALVHIFYERFARQQRFELPPEFPLASPYPGIDHHLSGPNMMTRLNIRPVDDIIQVYCCALSLNFRPTRKYTPYIMKEKVCQIFSFKGYS